jgi:hypothetical protein
MKTRLITFVALLFLTGCEPTPEEIQTADNYNKDAMKHPTIVGVTDDNLLIKSYTIHIAASGGTVMTHYIYVAIPYLSTNTPSTITINHEETVGKSHVNQVEVIINGTHMVAMPTVEKPEAQ